MASEQELLSEQSNLIAQIKEAHSRDRNRLIKQLNRVQQELKQPQLVYDHRGDIKLKGKSSDNYSFGPQQAEEAIAKKLTEEKGQAQIVQQDGRSYRVFQDGSFVETRSPQAQFSSGSGQINTLPSTPLGGVPVAPSAQGAATDYQTLQQQSVAAQQQTAENQFRDEARRAGFEDARIEESLRTGNALLPSDNPRVREAVTRLQGQGLNSPTIVNSLASGSPLEVTQNANISGRMGENNSIVDYDSPNRILNNDGQTQEGIYGLADYQQRAEAAAQGQARVARIANLLSGGITFSFKTFIDQKGVPLKQRIGNALTETPFEQRGRVGKFAERVVQTSIGLVNVPAIIDTGILIGNKLVLTSQGIVASPRNTVTEVFRDAPKRTGEEMTKLVTTPGGLGELTVLAATAGLGVKARAVEKPITVEIAKTKSITIPGEESTLKVTQSDIQSGGKTIRAQTIAMTKPDVADTNVVSQFTALTGEQGQILGIQKSVGKIYPQDSGAIGTFDIVGKVNVPNKNIAQQFQGKAQTIFTDIDEFIRTESTVTATTTKPLKTKPVMSAQEVFELEFTKSRQMVSDSITRGIEADIVQRPIQMKVNIEPEFDILIERSATFSRGISKTLQGKEVQKSIKAQGLDIENIKISTDLAPSKLRPITESDALKLKQLTATVSGQKTLVFEYLKSNRAAKVEAEIVPPVLVMNTPAPVTTRSRTQKDVFAGDVIFDSASTSSSSPEAEVQLISFTPNRTKQEQKFELDMQIASAPNLRSEFKPRLKTEMMLEIDSELKSDTLTRLKSDFRIDAKIRPDQVLKAAQLSRIKSEVLSKMQTQSESVLRSKTITASLPRAKTSTRSTPVGLDIDLDFDGEQGYDALVKERGKYIKVNRNPQGRLAALALAQEYVDITAAKSLRIVPTKGRPQTSESGYVFDESKLRRPKSGNTNIYIEKNKYAIDTEGERQGITAKGLMARRRGMMSSRILGTKLRTNKFKLEI